MNNMMDFPPFMIWIFVIIAVGMFAGTTQRRRQRLWLQGRPCPRCGQIHPVFARFCRRCGSRL